MVLFETLRKFSVILFEYYKFIDRITQINWVRLLKYIMRSDFLHNIYLNFVIVVSFVDAALENDADKNMEYLPNNLMRMFSDKNIWSNQNFKNNNNKMDLGIDKFASG